MVDEETIVLSEFWILDVGTAIMTNQEGEDCNSPGFTASENNEIRTVGKPLPGNARCVEEIGFVK